MPSALWRRARNTAPRATHGRRTRTWRFLIRRRVRGIVGRGHQTSRNRHGPGEMAAPAFTSFLIDTHGGSAPQSMARCILSAWTGVISANWWKPGGSHGNMLNLIAWVKSNAGQRLYRSQHELIGVFRVGGSPPQYDRAWSPWRSRSNVWKYAGVNTFRSGRMDDPRAPDRQARRLADAIKDCTQRNQIVIDTFSGSGTTLLAAERVGRKARAMDLIRVTSMSRSDVGASYRPGCHPCRQWPDLWRDCRAAHWRLCRKPARMPEASAMSPNNNARETQKDQHTQPSGVIAWAMAGRQPTRASSQEFLATQGPSEEGAELFGSDRTGPQRNHRNAHGRSRVAWRCQIGRPCARRSAKLWLANRGC